MLARRTLSTLALRRSGLLSAHGLASTPASIVPPSRARVAAPIAIRWSQRKTQYTTSAGDEQNQQQAPPPTGFLDRVVGKMNDGIRNNPAETIAVLFASDIGGMVAMYGLLSVSGIEFSPEFALAFVASRPFRRFRLPLDLASAAVVAKVFPAFARVRLSELANVMPGYRNRNRATAGDSSLVSKSVDKMFNVVDSYGAAYMMGSRLMGVGVVTALYFLIKQGVDVMPILAKLGVDELGTAAGSYAAAVVFSSAFYPVTLGITGYIVPVVAKARRTILP